MAFNYGKEFNIHCLVAKSVMPRVTRTIKGSQKVTNDDRGGGHDTPQKRWRHLWPDPRSPRLGRMLESLLMMTMALIFNNDDHGAIIIWQESLEGSIFSPHIISGLYLRYNINYQRPMTHNTTWQTLAIGNCDQNWNQGQMATNEMDKYMWYTLSMSAGVFPNLSATCLQHYVKQMLGKGCLWGWVRLGNGQFLKYIFILDI